MPKTHFSARIFSRFGHARRGMRRAAAAAAALLMLLCAALPAYAEGAENADTGYALPDGVTIDAESAILVSLGSTAEQDAVLFGRDADGVHAPGSMIRFAVVAYALSRVEETGMDLDTATGSYTKEMFDAFVAGTGVPTANMAFDETWTLRDLLIASFFQSASDAVTTLAFAIDGGVGEFVRGMNAFADRIGCDCTHFANVTGLDSLSQYTTPRDVYRIIRYAMLHYSPFEDIVSVRQHKIVPKAGGKERTLVASNSMLQSSSTYYYSPLVFGRTGLSDREGRTCASVARDSGYEYLTVVMSCPEENAAGQGGVHYRDTRTLMRWAFNNFRFATVLAKSEILATVGVRLSWSTDRVNLIPATEFSTVVENKLAADQVIRKVTLYEREIDAPVEKGRVLGKVELIVNVDQKLGEVDLVAADEIERNWLLYAWSGVQGFFTSIWFWVGIGVLILLIIGYIVLNIVYNRRRRRDRLTKVGRQR